MDVSIFRLLQDGVSYLRPWTPTVPAKFTPVYTYSIFVSCFFSLYRNLFRYLHLPALKTLEFRFYHGSLQCDNPLNLHHLMDSLTTFALINCAIHGIDLLDLLRASPNLLSLEFQVIGFNNFDYELLFQHLAFVKSTRDSESLRPKSPKT